MLNPDAVRNFELTFNANDASIPSAKLSEKEIVVLLKKSIYSILWADKIVMAFKRNEILYWGDLVVAYRKLYFTPKLGNKSLVVIETELAKQGLKFVDKKFQLFHILSNHYKDPKLVKRKMIQLNNYLFDTILV